MRILIVALLFALSALSAAAEELPSAEPLFAATLADLDDKPAPLAAYRGRALIVNFWARWCAPCRVEIPELARVRKQFGGERFEVVGIGLEDKTEAVRDFAKAYEMDYPVLLAKDKGIPLMQSLGNAKAGLPFTLVIDRRGQVVARKLGVMKREELEAAARAALK